MEVAAELWVLSLATPWQPLESRSPSKLKRMALQGERPRRGQSGTRILVLKKKKNLGAKGGVRVDVHQTEGTREMALPFSFQWENQKPVPKAYMDYQSWANTRRFYNHCGRGFRGRTRKTEAVRVQNRRMGPMAIHVLRR